jgi:CheY-like chemotaxis protein
LPGAKIFNAPSIAKQLGQQAPTSVIGARGDAPPEKPCVCVAIGAWGKASDAWRGNRKRMKNAAILVAVVDDDESVRESLPDFLNDFGFATVTFATAEEFLQSGVADDAKCLILDIAMPGMSGPELHRELVARGYSVPTIFMSARPEFASLPDMRQGAVECLLKPFSETALLEALEKALNLK